METWLKTCLLLCTYGFFKELRPSEPFLTEYLLGPQHNLTEEQVYYDVYPVWTYSFLSLLVVVFLVTDLLRYKPVIVFEGIGYVATWSLLLWARGVHWMQLMEFCYGISTSTEVAYYTYIYAQVDECYYQRVTSFTRSAILSGRFISGVLSQVLYSSGLLDYHTLNYFSLASVIVALAIAVILPPVRTSIYFHRESYISSTKDDESNESCERGEITSKETLPKTEKFVEVALCKNRAGTQDDKFWTTLKKVTRLLWSDFKEAYSNYNLLKWSIWWAFATCINFQVGNYIQPLWESLAPFQHTESLYNGAVEAASTLFGAMASFGVGYLHVNWTLFGEMTLGLISMIDAVLLLLMGLTDEIWVAYINYIAFRVSYQVLITIVSYQVARELKADSYGLIFGINMFLALLIQTILTFIVIEWLQLSPGSQFVVYGSYFCLLAFLFIIISSYDLGTLGCDGIRRQGIWEEAMTESKKNDAPVGITESY